MVETLHLQYFLGALVSLIVITNPLSKLPLFVSLTQGMSEERRRQQALWAGIYSATIMLVSLLGGNMLLAFFGISYGAMRIAGGLVVAMIGYQMLFGGNTPNNAPIVRRDKDDYAFFPIAMPGIAGPGTIAVVIGFSTEIAELKDYVDLAVALGWTAAAIIVTASASWAVMRYSDLLTRRLGPSGTLVLGKLMGFILICIGVQFVGSGIRTFMAGPRSIGRNAPNALLIPSSRSWRDCGACRRRFRAAAPCGRQEAVAVQHEEPERDGRSFPEDE